MIGEIADVVGVREGHREGRRVVRLALDPTRRLRAAHEVVFVVTYLGADAQPIWVTGHCLRHREHHWLHSCRARSKKLNQLRSYIFTVSVLRTFHQIWELIEPVLNINNTNIIFFFFFRLFPLGVARADFPSPVVSINCIFLRHFNLRHVLFHHIHKPPFWPSPFPLSWQLHPQHPSPNIPITFPP